MTEEDDTVVVVEGMVLNKFEGNLTDEEMASGDFEPIETVVLDGDGNIIEHYVREDTDAVN